MGNIHRFRIASGIATSIEAFSKRNRMELDPLVGGLTSSEWHMFAMMAGCADAYSPSEETRELVKEILRHDQQRACMGCGLRQGTREATASGRAGTEYCESCWRAEFPAVAA